MKTLDMKQVESHTGFSGTEHIKMLQVVVYVMCEGGLLGRLAAEQPADFYIDERVGRLPYSKTAIYQAVNVLVAHAKKEGLDTHNLPPVPFHGCGIF